ncbi:T9SS type A sorting domain-containing protein [Psychroserpens sp.]|uniref:T9SS type A sorting domain-containing protein n=1 Tax=Psychroserpens sp. TaxID=2020870 RepID=UPI002B26C925|nr:T9SS type A sorting domain-containing protein [Psychroserpens sp.]
MKHLLFILFLFPILCLSQCPPTSGIFTSQAQIDALAIDYPNCTEVGAFVISGDDITDLSGLNQIVSCTSFGLGPTLVLQNTIGLNSNIVIRYVEGTGTGFGISNNASLLTIDGLENFVSQSGFESSFTISDNPMLINIEGVPSTFDPLTWFSIVNNDSLINLNGLEDYCAGEITTISDNDSLVDLAGLDCASGSEIVRISNNDALISFNGLNQMWAGYSLYIENNAVLEDINIVDDNIGWWPEVTIQNNPNLSVCNSNWVCHFLYSVGVEESFWYPGTFENNAPGCNSNIEVEYACGINSNDNCGYPTLANQLVLGEPITANNEFATTSSQTPSCNDITNRKDVWFAFNSGDNTIIDVLIQAGFYVQLWEGECYELTQVNNACGTQLDDMPVAPNTIYYVQVWNDDPADRGGSSWFNLTVQDGTLSTQDFQFETVKIFPNPVDDVLNIQSNEAIDKVEIFNLLGQRIKALDIGSNPNSIDMSDLSQGLYLIQVGINGKDSTYKVLKK